MRTRSRYPSARPRRAVRLLLVTALVAGALGALGAPAAHAAPIEVTATGLSWRVSQQVWTASSLAPLRGADAPATFDSGTTWTFPEGTGTYDPDTGATSIQYAGALFFGNTAQGNYLIRIADPELTVNEDGAGELTALVNYRLGSPTFTEATRVPVTTFTVAPGDVTVDGGHVSWTVTPDYPGEVGARQFPQAFLDVLNAGLRNHFRDAGTAADANKPPAPLSVELDFPVPTGIDATATPILKGELAAQKDFTKLAAEVTNAGVHPITVNNTNVAVSATINGDPVEGAEFVVKPVTKTLKPGKSYKFPVQWNHGDTLHAGDVVELSTCAVVTDDDTPGNDCSTITRPGGDLDFATSTLLKPLKAKYASGKVTVTLANVGDPLTAVPAVLRSSNVDVTIRVNDEAVEAPALTSNLDGKRKIVKPGKATKATYTWTYGTGGLAKGDTVEVTTCVAVPGDLNPADDCSTASGTVG